MQEYTYEQDPSARIPEVQHRIYELFNAILAMDTAVPYSAEELQATLTPVDEYHAAYAEQPAPDSTEPVETEASPSTNVISLDEERRLRKLREDAFEAAIPAEETGYVPKVG